MCESLSDHDKNIGFKKEASIHSSFILPPFLSLLYPLSTPSFLPRPSLSPSLPLPLSPSPSLSLSSSPSLSLFLSLSLSHSLFFTLSLFLSLSPSLSLTLSLSLSLLPPTAFQWCAKPWEDRANPSSEQGRHERASEQKRERERLGSKG